MLKNITRLLFSYNVIIITCTIIRWISIWLCYKLRFPTRTVIGCSTIIWYSTVCRKRELLRAPFPIFGLFVLGQQHARQQRKISHQTSIFDFSFFRCTEKTFFCETLHFQRDAKKRSHYCNDYWFYILQGLLFSVP